MVVTPPPLHKNWHPLLGIPTRVVKVEQDFISYNWRKNESGRSECDKAPNGWYALFQGSRERVFMGVDKPDLEKDEEILIVIYKRKKSQETANNANTGSTPVANNDQASR